MARLCKRAREQGWVELGSRMNFCVRPKLEGNAHEAFWLVWILQVHSYSPPCSLLSLSLSFFSFLLFFSILFFFFSSLLFSLSFSFFFKVNQSWSFYRLGYSLNRTCSGLLTNIPHTWTFVCRDTKSQVCGVGVPFSMCSITSEYLVYSWNSSHVPWRRMSFVFFNLNLKGLATKNTRRSILS